MKILTLQNPKEEKTLRHPLEAADTQKIKLEELRELAKKMRGVMKEAEGVGLSANQVGLNLRFFVAQVPDMHNNIRFYVLLNPAITKISKETQKTEEGCLSVPGQFGLVERSSEIILEAVNLQGKKVKIHAWGLLARVFQHEVDHLDGKLFIDKCKNLHRIQ